VRGCSTTACCSPLGPVAEAALYRSVADGELVVSDFRRVDD